MHMLVAEGLDSNAAPPLGGRLGGDDMANLKEEYTDIRNRRHMVKHMIVPSEDKAERERIMEELFYALTKAGKKLPA